ncbi:MAG TPA: pyridoxamine 5'-phosphate oxidase family protein [Anaerolineales bacterium]|nr:pyridoxamine 5'-phosphate oxidase family protein [Anaerolineales bacterium]
MASYYPSITEEQAKLIQNSPVFFVATAAPTPSDISEGVGPINISPKGGAPLHILNPNRVAFLNYAGSGNETERHSASGSPITLMICSFEGEDAAIVRLYGQAKVMPIAESELAQRLLETGATAMKLTPRQIVEIEIEKTSTSCGYGVPVMEFVRDRRTVDHGRRYKK